MWLTESNLSNLGTYAKKKCMYKVIHITIIYNSKRLEIIYVSINREDKLWCNSAMKCYADIKKRIRKYAGIVCYYLYKNWRWVINVFDCIHLK